MPKFAQKLSPEQIKSLADLIYLQQPYAVAPTVVAAAHE